MAKRVPSPGISHPEGMAETRWWQRPVVIAALMVALAALDVALIDPWAFR